MFSRHNFTFLAALAVAAQSASAQPAPTTKPVATLVLTAPDGPVKLGAIARLKFVLTNISESDFTIDAWENYQIDILDEKGNLAPETDLGTIWNHRMNADHTAKRVPGPPRASKSIYQV